MFHLIRLCCVTYFLLLKLSYGLEYVFIEMKLLLVSFICCNWPVGFHPSFSLLHEGGPKFSFEVLEA